LTSLAMVNVPQTVILTTSAHDQRWDGQRNAAKPGKIDGLLRKRFVLVRRTCDAGQKAAGKLPGVGDSPFPGAPPAQWYGH
jgi:hypothetical protein